MRLLLIQGIDANQTNDAGFNPLMILILNHYTNDMEKLITLKKFDLTYRVILNNEKVEHYLNPRKSYYIKQSANAFELAMMLGRVDLAFYLSQAMNTDLMRLVDNYVNTNNVDSTNNKRSSFSTYINFLKKTLQLESIRNNVNAKKVFIAEFYKNMHLLDPDSDDLLLIIHILDHCMSDAELVNALDTALKLESTIRIGLLMQDFYLTRILNAAKELFYSEDLHNPNGLLIIKYYLRLAKEGDLKSNLSNKHILTFIKNLLTHQSEMIILNSDQIEKLWIMLKISKRRFTDSSEYSKMHAFLTQLSQHNNYDIKQNNIELYQSIVSVNVSGSSLNNITLFSNNPILQVTTEQNTQDIDDINSCHDCLNSAFK
jgi:hypothetical protein